MEKGLTIESEEAASLATTLAALRGESVEAVVTTALRDALERNRAEREGAAAQHRTPNIRNCGRSLTTFITTCGIRFLVRTIPGFTMTKRACRGDR